TCIHTKSIDTTIVPYTTLFRSIATSTIIKERLIAMRMPFLCLNKVLNITKLIANETTNIVIAITIFKVIKKIITITKNMLDMIDIVFTIFELIRLTLLVKYSKYIALLTEIVSYLPIFQYVIFNIKN